MSKKNTRGRPIAGENRFEVTVYTKKPANAGTPLYVEYKQGVQQQGDRSSSASTFTEAIQWVWDDTMTPESRFKHYYGMGVQPPGLAKKLSLIGVTLTTVGSKRSSSNTGDDDSQLFTPIVIAGAATIGRDAFYDLLSVCMCQKENGFWFDNMKNVVFTDATGSEGDIVIHAGTRFRIHDKNITILERFYSKINPRGVTIMISTLSS